MGSKQRRASSEASRKANRSGTSKGKHTKKVWERDAPAKAPHHHLTPKKKAAAKAAARRAGRHYPNLVDNIRAAAPRRAGSSK